MKFFCLVLYLVNSELLYLISVSRHGARAPIRFLPWDDLAKWPDGPSQLLASGMRQHYLLGTYLREVYMERKGFLSSFYNSSEIFIYSTGISRTMLSMQAQLLGLYPRDLVFPSISLPGLKNCSENVQQIALQKPLIPIHLDALKIEPMLLAQDYCRLYKTHVEAQKSSTGIRKVYFQHREVVNVIEKFFNITVEAAQDYFLTVYGSIVSNQFEGFSYPHEFSFDWQEKAKKLYVDIREYQRYTPQYLAKFAASQFFLEIISQFEEKIQKKLTRKAMIYSAHDTSIMNIFATIGVKLSEQPPFASMVNFELITENGEMFVKMIYNAENVFIPTCGEICKFEMFKKHVFSRVFRNVTQACMGIADLYGKFIPSEDNEYMWDIVVVDAAVMVVALIVIFSVVKKNLRIFE